MRKSQSGRRRKMKTQKTTPATQFQRGWDGEQFPNCHSADCRKEKRGGGGREGGIITLKAEARVDFRELGVPADQQSFGTTCDPREDIPSSCSPPLVLLIHRRMRGPAGGGQPALRLSHPELWEGDTLFLWKSPFARQIGRAHV